MYKKVFLKIEFLLIVFMFIFAQNSISYAGEETLDIKAVSAMLVESNKGQILYEKDPNYRLHISSVNKIMTAILALNKASGKLDSMVTISKNAAAVEGSILNLEVGGKYSVEDLVAIVILHSANDAANALAEYVGGDVNSFIDIMNNKARDLKMLDTYFTNPTGLYDEAQYTTANDTAILMRYALADYNFNRIFSTDYKAIPNKPVLVNSNELFWRYDGVDGGKTGYNEINNQTAITTVTRNNQRLICIVLDSPMDSIYEDSIKILDYGFQNFRLGVLVQKNQVLKRIQIGDDNVELVSIKDFYYTYPVGENYIKNIEYSIINDMKPPITKDVVLGTAKYILKDGTVIDVKLYPSTDIYSSVDMLSSLVGKMIEYKEITILLITLIVVEIILLLYNLFKLIRNVFLKISKN